MEKNENYTQNLKLNYGRHEKCMFEKRRIQHFLTKHLLPPEDEIQTKSEEEDQNRDLEDDNNMEENSLDANQIVISDESDISLEDWRVPFVDEEFNKVWVRLGP